MSDLIISFDRSHIEVYQLERDWGSCTLQQHNNPAWVDDGSFRWCHFTQALSHELTVRRLDTLSIVGLASPSSSTNAMPGLTMSGDGAATTVPVVLLYLDALAEGSKTVVMVVSAGGVGMKLVCCRRSRALCSFPSSCSAANCNHFKASAQSCSTP